MSWRFRRRFRLFPGLWLNLSKSGVSASVGGPGLTYNTRGRVTVSAPGTGLSYQHNLKSGGHDPLAPSGDLPFDPSCQPDPDDIPDPNEVGFDAWSQAYDDAYRQKQERKRKLD